MAKTLLEMFEKNLVKVGDYIEYRPYQGGCLLKVGETGVWSENEEEQYFYTEMMKFQFAGMLKDKLLLISDEITKQIIRFDGDIGCLKGAQTLNKIAIACWSNLQLGAMGYVLNYFDYSRLPEEVKKTKSGKRCYWLSSTGAVTGHNKSYSGLNYVDETNSPRKIKTSEMVDGTTSSYRMKRRGVEMAIRPAVLLPKDVCIY